MTMAHCEILGRPLLLPVTSKFAISSRCISRLCTPCRKEPLRAFTRTNIFARFPLFHKQSFIARVNNQEHLQNQGLFASTMAVCSLVSGRARDGALYSSRWRREELLEPPSEAFYAAAKDALPRDLAAARGMNYMRACAILAIASIQNGQIKNMQKYSGMYHTLTHMEGLHDEKLWPKDIGPIEIEERRRLVRTSSCINLGLRLTKIPVLVYLYTRHLFKHCLGRCHSIPRGSLTCSLSE